MHFSIKYVGIRKQMLEKHPLEMFASCLSLVEAGT